MSRSFPQANATDGTKPVALKPSTGSTLVDLDQLRAWIRAAIENTGWNQDALSAHMQKDKGYISRVLNGEKPLSAEFLRALPDDVEALMARFWAESFGQIVVAPAASRDAAVRNFISGLFGMLETPQALPVKAGPPIKATLKRRA